MIEINLLPQELKSLPRKKAAGSYGERILLNLVPLIAGTLAIMHVLLGASFFLRLAQFSSLDTRWEALAEQRKVVEEFRKEYLVLAEEDKAVQQFVRQRVNWSQKLSRLSVQLPAGVWFSEMAASAKSFTLKGSAFSVEGQEMDLISRFMGGIKNDDAFFSDFGGLELGPIQRRRVGGYDVVDFTLTGNLKAK